MFAIARFHSDVFDRWLPLACLLQMLNSTLEDTADFVKKKPVTCRRTKVPRVSLYGVVKKKKQLVAFTDSQSQFYFVPCSRFAWPYKAFEERTAIKRELLYLKIIAFDELVSKSNDGISQFLRPDGK